MHRKPSYDGGMESKENSRKRSWKGGFNVGAILARDVIVVEFAVFRRARWEAGQGLAFFERLGDGVGALLKSLIVTLLKNMEVKEVGGIMPKSAGGLALGLRPCY